MQPLLEGKADMVIGYPLRKHDTWDSADLLRIQRWLSGERAVWRLPVRVPAPAGVVITMPAIDRSPRPRAKPHYRRPPLSGRNAGRD